MLQFKPGDKVIVDKDLVKAKQLQKGHGGFCAGMEKVRYLQHRQHIHYHSANVMDAA